MIPPSPNGTHIFRRYPHDTFFILYAVWWLVPLFVALLSFSETSTTAIYVQALAVIWLLGIVAFAIHPTLGFLVSGFAIIAAWVPAFVQTLRRIVTLWPADRSHSDVDWSPVVFMVNTLCEQMLWFIPTTILLVILIQQAIQGTKSFSG